MRTTLGELKVQDVSRGVTCCDKCNEDSGGHSVRVSACSWASSPLSTCIQHVQSQWHSALVVSHPTVFSVSPRYIMARSDALKGGCPVGVPTNAAAFISHNTHGDFLADIYVVFVVWPQHTCWKPKQTQLLPIHICTAAEVLIEKIISALASNTKTTTIQQHLLQAGTISPTSNNFSNQELFYHAETTCTTTLLSLYSRSAPHKRLRFPSSNAACTISSFRDAQPPQCAGEHLDLMAMASAA